MSRLIEGANSRLVISFYFYLKVNIMNVFISFKLLLIPKKAEAMDIKDFHFISLVGVVYKIVSKVLANSLTTALENVISRS